MRHAAMGALFALCLNAQQASLEGIAVDALTGEPLPGVHVKLVTGVAGGATGSYGAISDRAGHFAIATIRPGAYAVFCERAGYLHLQDVNAAIRSITFKPGQVVKDHRIEMTPRAILAGRVVDENGDPVQGATLELVAAPPSVLPVILLSVGQSATDDRGEFRIAGAPGKYYLKAWPPGDLGGGIEHRNDGSRTAAYATTFYPSSTVKDRGTVIEAVAGKDTAGLEIRLARQQGFRISGTVTGIASEDGRAQVTLNALSEGNPLGRGVLTQPDGTFEFPGIPPGTYHLSAGARRGKTQFTTRNVEVQVAAGDPAPVTLTLVPGAEVTGTLTIEGDPPGEFYGKLAVRLQSADPNSNNQIRMDGGEVDREHSFRIEGVAPSRYRIRVEGMPENAYLKKVEVDGQVAPDDGIDLSNGGMKTTAKLTVSRAGAQISGRVLDSDGDPLSMRLAIVALRRNESDISGAGAGVEVTPAGRYSMEGIAPGKYRLFGIDPFQLGFGTGDGLKKFYERGEEIEVKEGDRITKDVKLLPKEDANAKQ
jgi:protocatechuate 3,4-dioxygenase beta subunit